MRYETITLYFRTCDKTVIIHDQDMIDDFMDIVKRREEYEDDSFYRDESDLIDNIRECEDYTIINVCISTFEGIETETGDDDSVDDEKIKSIYRDTSNVIKTFDDKDPAIYYEIGGHGWSIDMEVPIEDDEDFDIDKLSIVDTIVKVGNSNYTATTFLYNNEPVEAAASDIITGSYENITLSYNNGESTASL